MDAHQVPIIIVVLGPPGMAIQSRLRISRTIKNVQSMVEDNL